MSNITWSNIRDTIKSIFDNKDTIHSRKRDGFNAKLYDDNEIRFWYSDKFRFVSIGVLTQNENGYQINLKNSNIEITIPLDVHDEIEFVLINGRPSDPEIDFIRILDKFLDPNYSGRKKLT